ncbi:XrtA system polysaccharide deacetylase [Pseudomaricurvus alkylphenolicus]|uniref:XrtA system polysaccharide deacetylase n=1 Tax=Pseudomaricurvus alkylphenolicus TaxID=1306991 RepID=UPI001F0E52A7|nr:XrtA system polysaccharide deacetylase [Pseudomaricurvus alkylphenolicus]
MNTVQQSTKAQRALVNAMTVDVEDYFQVSAFEGVINREDWGAISYRVEQNTDRILELFSETGTHATFFTLGCVAERFPQMLKRIVEQGHELASHGWNHTRVVNQNPMQFREDVDRTRKLLEDLGGTQVKGYRAASYSIGSQNLWALDVLAETGHLYSSSIAPVKHDLYGMPEASRFPFRYGEHQILEIPITTVKLMGKNINCAGGGWFRLFPYGFTRWCLNVVNKKERQPCIFYFHPWEIDHTQPKVDGASAKSRFRHYLNLDKTHARLEQLLTDFRWGRMDDIFLAEANHTEVSDVMLNEQIMQGES